MAAEVALPIPQAKRDVRLRLYIKLLVLDCIIIGAVFLAVGDLFGPEWMALDKINLMAMVIPIYVGIAIKGNAYSLQALAKPFPAAAQAILNMMFAMLAIQCVLYFAHVSDEISRFSFAVALIVSALLLAALRRPFARYAMRRTGGKLTDDLILADGVIIGEETGSFLANAELHNLRPDLHDPQMLNRLGRWLRSFDRVVIACLPERRHAWAIVLQGAAVQGEIMLTDARESGAIGLGQCMGHDTHVVSRGPLSMSSRVQKRAFDLAITVPAIIALGPLLVLVAIAIKLESRGPVLFLQERVGLGNRLFKIAGRPPVESGSGAVSCGAPVGLARRSVSTPCSSNRTCRSPASGSRTR
ncbi:sugar transferase, partial [Sphingobium sp. WCS2017Hpa-17]|uniref:sugar transferase n=1 Tax=Sphingobium sp. WCS2017Hpa-17 TaxID=3073638 RepID=UPI00288B9B7B